MQGDSTLIESSNRHQTSLMAARGWAEGRQGGALGVEPHVPAR